MDEPFLGDDEQRDSTPEQDLPENWPLDDMQCEQGQAIITYAMHHIGGH